MLAHTPLDGCLPRHSTIIVRLTYERVHEPKWITTPEQPGCLFTSRNVYHSDDSEGLSPLGHTLIYWVPALNLALARSASPRSSATHPLVWSHRWGLWEAGGSCANDYKLYYYALTENSPSETIQICFVQQDHHPVWLHLKFTLLQKENFWSTKKNYR